MMHRCHLLCMVFKGHTHYWKAHRNTEWASRKWNWEFYGEVEGLHIYFL